MQEAFRLAAAALEKDDSPDKPPQDDDAKKPGFALQRSVRPKVNSSYKVNSGYKVNPNYTVNSRPEVGPWVTASES